MLHDIRHCVQSTTGLDEFLNSSEMGDASGTEADHLQVYDKRQRDPSQAIMERHTYLKHG